MSIHVAKWANTAVWQTPDTSIQLAFGEFLPWGWCCAHEGGEKPSTSLEDSADPGRENRLSVLSSVILSSALGELHAGYRGMRSGEMWSNIISDFTRI